jgi:hypothetical protein
MRVDDLSRGSDPRRSLQTGGALLLESEQPPLLQSILQHTTMQLQLAELQSQLRYILQQQILSRAA